MLQIVEWKLRRNGEGGGQGTQRPPINVGNSALKTLLSTQFSTNKNHLITYLARSQLHRLLCPSVC